jgi:hypothetical protein
VAERPKIPDWESLLANAAFLQTKVPGAVLEAIPRRHCMPGTAFLWIMTM